MTFAPWLHGLYLFTTVFGVGVTVVDMLGILGHGSHHGDHDVGAHHGDHDSSTPAGEHADGYVPFLLVLRYLRTMVYFSLGFGPLGLMAEATGSSVAGSLAWAVPGGLAAAWLAGVFFRWQRHDVDSTVQAHELLAERARVIVPLSSTAMGRVRLKVGQSVIERYALAEDDWESLRTNDVVEVVRVTDECVYVRRAIGHLSSDAS
jgi:membrane protein implicated in regulation of membrane protease activity